MKRTFRSPRVPKCPWEKQEAGWYIHPKLGGICLEADGKWWFYTRDGFPCIPMVSGKMYRTLKAAKRAAERKEKT